MGKKFRYRDFRFKIRFKTFWIDSDQNFLTKSFFDYFGHLGKKWLSPWKNFDFQIFLLKYVSKHTESISTKNISTKIFWLCHFFTIFGPKIRFFEVFGVKKFSKIFFIVVLGILFPKFLAKTLTCTLSHLKVITV